MSVEVLTKGVPVCCDSYLCAANLRESRLSSLWQYVFLSQLFMGILAQKSVCVCLLKIISLG